MGEINKRGVYVPGVGDDLLGGWETWATQSGTWVSVASVDAAKAMLDGAAAAGIGATSSLPMMFVIGSGVKKVAYMADGSKTSGKWNLAPLNETDAKENTLATGTELTLNARQYSNLITSNLTAAPFDRIVIATASLYGRVTSGLVNGRLWVSTTDYVDARFDTGNDDPSNVPLVNSGIIPANTAPSIRVGFAGDRPSGNSVINVAANSALNRLVVTAWPISMAV